HAGHLTRAGARVRGGPTAAPAGGQAARGRCSMRRSTVRPRAITRIRASSTPPTARVVAQPRSRASSRSTSSGSTAAIAAPIPATRATTAASTRAPASPASTSRAPTPTSRASSSGVWSIPTTCTTGSYQDESTPARTRAMEPSTIRPTPAATASIDATSKRSRTVSTVSSPDTGSPRSSSASCRRATSSRRWVQGIVVPPGGLRGPASPHAARETPPPRLRAAAVAAAGPDVQPHHRAGGRGPQLDEVAHLVGDPQAPAAHVPGGRTDPPGQRVGHPATIADLHDGGAALAPGPHVRHPLAVADAVGRHLVDGEDEVPGPRPVQPGVPPGLGDRAPQPPQPRAVEGPRGQGPRRLRQGLGEDGRRVPDEGPRARDPPLRGGHQVVRVVGRADRLRPEGGHV